MSRRRQRCVSTDLQSLIHSVHHRRYLQRKIGVPVEDIAKADGVTVDRVKRSVAQIEELRAALTQEVANSAIVDIILESQPAVKRAINEGLCATTFEEIEGEEGAGETVPDHHVRMRAVEVYKDLVVAIQPKGGGIHVQANAGVVNGAQPGTKFSSYEDRLREIRATLPPAPSQDAIEGEIVVQELDADVSNQAQE